MRQSVVFSACFASLHSRYWEDRAGTTSATPWQHSALYDVEMDGWIHSGVERRGVDIYLDIWFIYWRSTPNILSLLLFFVSMCSRCLSAQIFLHRSGTFSMVEIHLLFFFSLVNIWGSARSIWEKYNAENEFTYFNDSLDIFSDAFLRPNHFI